MKKNESLQDFYQIPENSHLIHSIDNEIVEDFNIFQRWHCMSVKKYTRRDFFRIGLIIGTGKLTYSDKSLLIKKPTLFIADKTTPYSWEPLSEYQKGWVCLFTDSFLNSAKGYYNDQIYPILHSTELPVYSLNEDSLSLFSNLFNQMMEEFQSDYTYKKSLLQNYLQILIHHIQKLGANHFSGEKSLDAAHRISYQFLELLEQQFPIESPDTPLLLKQPSDFAEKLHIHVNHLNHSIKKVTGKHRHKSLTTKLFTKQRNYFKTQIGIFPKSQTH